VSFMKLIVPLTFLLFGGVVMVWLMSGAQAAQVQQEAHGALLEGKVTELMSRNLPDLPGKEGVMLTVEYPPGGSDPSHRHNADVFVYVLEGSIVMQLRGGEEMTLTPGQTFYEGHDDVHVVSRNASATEPAKFVVFFVKDIGAPVLVPAT
jgi:quercetin dioxygenase-like cupin family protein